MRRGGKKEHYCRRKLGDRGWGNITNLETDLIFERGEEHVPKTTTRRTVVMKLDDVVTRGVVFLRLDDVSIREWNACSFTLRNEERKKI